MKKDEKAFHQFTAEEIARHWETSLEHGLSPQSARERLARFWRNQLVEKKGISAWAIFLDQFKDLIMWVLIGAAVVSGFLREWLDAGAIGAILVMNAILGFLRNTVPRRRLPR